MIYYLLYLMIGFAVHLFWCSTENNIYRKNFRFPFTVIFWPFPAIMMFRVMVINKAITSMRRTKGKL